MTAAFFQAPMGKDALIGKDMRQFNLLEGHKALETFQPDTAILYRVFSFTLFTFVGSDCSFRSDRREGPGGVENRNLY